jgi:TonB family protein
MIDRDTASVPNGGSLRGRDGKRLAVAAALALAIDSVVLVSLSVLLAGATRAAASDEADAWISVRLEARAPLGTELAGTELKEKRPQDRAIAAEAVAIAAVNSSSVPVTETANAAAGPALGTELGPAASAAASAATVSSALPDTRTGSGDAGTELGITTREDILVRLDEAIKRKLNYPPRARERGIEGRVLLEILVDEAGSLRNCAVETSSGSPMLDSAARRLLSDIFPLRASLASSFSAYVAVEYRLR